MLDFNLGIQFFKGAPLGVFDGLQFFNGTYLATVLQSWFIGVRFFKAEICPGSHSLRGYQWSLKDSGVRVGGRIARGMNSGGFSSHVGHKNDIHTLFIVDKVILGI